MALWLGLGAVVAVITYGGIILRRPSQPPALRAPAENQPSVPTNVPPVATSGPRVKWATTDYDFGRVTGDALVDCVFVFTNVGNATLEVTNVTPFCSCMTAMNWTRRVEPGQTGTIPIRYNSQHYIGYFAKSVSVGCTDPTQANIMLQVKGTVWRPIEIKPLSAVLNLNAEAPSNATTVQLISHLDEPLTLSDLTNTCPGMTVQLQTNQPGKEFQLDVRTAHPLPTNSQRGQITLKTSTTNQPLVSINAFVNVMPILTAIPNQVRLPALPRTNAWTATLLVRNHGTNTVEYSEPVVTVPGVDVQIKTNPPDKNITLVLTLPAGFQMPPGQTTAELRLKTSHPLIPLFRVPVVQAPPAAFPEPPRPVR